MNLSHLVGVLRDMTPEQRDTFFDLYHERVAEPHPAVFAKFAQDNVDVTEGPRVVTEILTAVAIVQANAVSMGGESEHGCGVFASYSRMNHSCTPNVHNSYNPTVRKLTIHATHQINKGEEITATCINFNRAHEQRTADLSNWDIICTCKSCAGPTAAASDKRRLRMFEADQKIAAYRQGMQHNLGLSIPRNAHEALEVAEEMLVVIREEGITGFSLTGVYRECAVSSFACDSTAKAIKYAKKELEIERDCIVTETAHLEEDMTSAEFWLQYMISEQKKSQEQHKVEERLRKENLAKEAAAAKAK